MHNGPPFNANVTRQTALGVGPKDTMDRLEAAVKTRGMTIFARIDHAAGASSARTFHWGRPNS
jgi:uncharacterized protein (DUF302 family)